MLTAPSHFSLGTGGTVALSAVADHPFVCLPPGSGLHQLLRQAADREGFTPHIDFEADTPARIRELVSAGLGVAILAESIARAPGPPIRVRALADPPISLITLSAPAPPAAAFVAHLRRPRQLSRRLLPAI